MKSTCPPDCHLVNSLRNREFQGEMKVQKHLEIDVSAGLSLGRHTRPQQFPVENFTTVLHQLSERSDSKSPHLRDLRKTQKHHIFSRITSFLEPVSAETRVQAWPKSQRQRSWQPESSISDVEAVCRGQFWFHSFFVSFFSVPIVVSSQSSHVTLELTCLSR